MTRLSENRVVEICGDVLPFLAILQQYLEFCLKEKMCCGLRETDAHGIRLD